MSLAKKNSTLKKMHIDIRTLSVHKSLEQQQIENKSIETCGLMYFRVAAFFYQVQRYNNQNFN